MKKMISLLACNMLSLLVYAQISTPPLNPGLSSYYDTVKAKSEDLFVLHYHEVSDKRKKQMIFSNVEGIFDDSTNKFSRMIIINPVVPSTEINIPTIPLENIIILKEKGLIIGLTRIKASPYLVVIYNLNGKLLYKGNLGASTLMLTKGRLRKLVTKYPSLLEHIENSNSFKEGDTCFIELSRSMLNAIGRDSARSEFTGEIIFGRYVPYKIVLDGGGIYSRYQGFYRYSDPFQDLIMIGSVPYILILNTEDGKQVNIPLISNCDLRRELEND
jgi:hypothetical protein